MPTGTVKPNIVPIQTARVQNEKFHVIGLYVKRLNVNEESTKKIRYLKYCVL